MALGAGVAAFLAFFMTFMAFGMVQRPSLAFSATLLIVPGRQLFTSATGQDKAHNRDSQNLVHCSNSSAAPSSNSILFSAQAAAEHHQAERTLHFVSAQAAADHMCESR